MNQEDFFERITKQFQQELPFVAYRKPNEETVKALLQKDNELHKVEDYSESGFVFTPFNDVEDSVLIPVKNSETIVGDFENQNILKNYFTEVLESSKDKEQHVNLLQKGIEAINAGEFQKVVLSRCEEVGLTNSKSIEIYKELLQNYAKAFVYCWYHPKVGLWLGATPETLLTIDGNRLTTMALAGTQSYDGTVEVEWHQKEIEEQHFVTNFIIDALGDEIEQINVSETQTIRAGTLLHLQTKISGTFNIQLFNFQHFLHKLHPTPAVCGLPKESSKQFIRNNENYNREFYTGFLGELNMKSKIERRSTKRNVENRAYNYSRKMSHLFVNLRCMQIKNDKALIYVGGGITKDSKPEAEWQETVNKTMTMKKVL